MNRIANLDIEVTEVDAQKLRTKGIEVQGRCKHVRVAFLTGPLFFAATGFFNEAFAHLENTHALILSMRGVPLVDTAGIETNRRLYEKLHRQGGALMLVGVHGNVCAMLKRSGLKDEIGEQNFFWSSDQAIVEAEKRGCTFCGPENDGSSYRDGTEAENQPQEGGVLEPERQFWCGYAKGLKDCHPTGSQPGSPARGSADLYAPSRPRYRHHPGGRQLRP